MFNELFSGGIDMRKLGTRFEVPIIIFAGERDLGTPTAVVKRWFATIAAPHKALHIIPGAGHFVFAERPGETLVRLVTEVRPLAFGGPSQTAGNQRESTA